MTQDELDRSRWDDDGGAQPIYLRRGQRGKLYRKLREALDRQEQQGKYTPGPGYRNYPVNSESQQRPVVTVQHRTADPWHDLPFDFEYAE